MAHAALKVMVTTPEPNEKKLASLANSSGADKFSAVGISGGCARLCHGGDPKWKGPDVQVPPDEAAVEDVLDTP